MPVDQTHKEYDRNLPDWEMIDDICEGQRAIKEAGVKYLPMLGGQDPADYDSYKQRGSFFNAFARTVQGLVGYIFRKDVDHNLPDAIVDILPRIMSTGQSDLDLYRLVTNCEVKYGRVGLLVDSARTDENDDSNYEPFIAVYKPDSITNWQVEYINGKETLTLLVLKESVQRIGDDEFDIVDVVRYRVFHLRDEGVEINIWEKKRTESGKEEWVIDERYYPKLMNKAQDRILFHFIGSEENISRVNRPPLLDMANINIAHWQLSVDYRHGLHFCSLPTPYAFGFDDETELHIGPTTVWRSTDKDAKCGYTEFSGNGLKAQEIALRSDEEFMAILGARVIEHKRSRVETAESARIRQSGESSMLISLVKNINAGLTAAFKDVARWMGIDPDGIYVNLNMDFVDTEISAQEIGALLQSYQAGAISLETFLYNMEKGEILSPDTSIEDEMLRIESDKNSSFENEAEFSPVLDEEEEEIQEGEEDGDNDAV